MLTTALFGILMLVVIVIIHECGHALVARICGVGVAEFGVGFSKPRIKLFTIGNCPVYLCLWLLGGYVRLKARDDKKSHGAGGTFIEDATLSRKIFIFAGGVLANLVSAVFLRMIIFIVAPHGVTFDFIYPMELGEAPVWYLIPAYAVYEVVVTFALWSFAMIIGIFIAIPVIIASIFSATPAPGGGMIATIGLGSAIHNSAWSYLAVVYYMSVVVAALNLIPLLPFDGGQIVLAIVQKILLRVFGEGRAYRIFTAVYRYSGLIFIGVLLVAVVMSDISDIIRFFGGK